MPEIDIIGQAQTAKPRYFRSFAAYEIPLRPTEPVGFAQTEGLAAFCQATFDPVGRVLTFDKVRILRAGKREIELSKPLKPETLIYFDAAGDKVGSELAYVKTESLPQFYVGMVDPTGKKCLLNLLCKEVAFADLYEYWPNGRLRTRTSKKPDSKLSITQYKAQGEPISAATPALSR